MMTILIYDTFSKSRRPLQNLYSRLRRDLEAVENGIKQELSGQMAGMENTLIMKIEDITTKSVPTGKESFLADEYTFGDSDEYSGYSNEYSFGNSDEYSGYSPSEIYELNMGNAGKKFVV